ncbi:DinB family protein [Cohnella sp. JJ-181]|uniref:DinB family protein n=1 Tax=Cohnella rhizoplanae TaxID=2974897 RepID=UPI0022FF55ED|nr:DinB family protein [Cohnella sp. JJ-181]CAI6033373.1 hypothetical protein COHCIP112018_00794 [Cohnella sp. JJ-181]
MFTTIASFAQEWKREADMTSGLLDALTDGSLDRQVAEGRRTLGGLAWHLVTSIQFMGSLGLSIDGLGDGEGGSGKYSAVELAAAYRTISDSFLAAIQAQWTDDDLSVTVPIAGEAWENGASLRFALMHQAHHRGQMTVLMRQAGLRPPGLYGPTYETWIEQGMAPRE